MSISDPLLLWSGLPVYVQMMLSPGGSVLPLMVADPDGGVPARVKEPSAVAVDSPQSWSRVLLTAFTFAVPVGRLPFRAPQFCEAQVTLYDDAVERVIV